MAAKPTQVSTFRNDTFLLAVRTHLVTRLVRDHGFERPEAREIVGHLNDAIIEEGAHQVAPDSPKALPPGGILAFILQFLQSPAFAQLLALLLSLFASPPAPPAPPSA